VEGGEQVWGDEAGDGADEVTVHGEHFDGERLVGLAGVGGGVDGQGGLSVRGGGQQAEVAAPWGGEELA
jgi:hypothetical protein